MRQSLSNFEAHGPFASSKPPARTKKSNVNRFVQLVKWWRSNLLLKAVLMLPSLMAHSTASHLTPILAAKKFLAIVQAMQKELHIYYLQFPQFREQTLYQRYV